MKVNAIFLEDELTLGFFSSKIIKETISPIENILASEFVDLLKTRIDDIDQSVDIKKITENLNTENLNFEFGIGLFTENQIKEMNNDFRNKNTPTNILSFPNFDFDQLIEILSCENDEPIYLGDLALSMDIVKAEAAKENKDIFAHLSHLLIHGFLHLLSYDHIDEKEADIMENKEITILANLSINNPYREN